MIMTLFKVFCDWRIGLDYYEGGMTAQKKKNFSQFSSGSLVSLLQSVEAFELNFNLKDSRQLLCLKNT
jgi:hypothetical protein